MHRQRRAESCRSRERGDARSRSPAHGSGRSRRAPRPPAAVETLSAPAVSSLAAFLTPGARTSKLAHLDLASTNIANKGVTQLSLALVGNSVLTSLCLRKCNVTASGATALAQVLAGGRAGALAELDVSWNHISPAGTQALLLALAGASAEEACQYAAPVVPAAARLLPRVAADGGSTQDPRAAEASRRKAW